MALLENDNVMIAIWSCAGLLSVMIIQLVRISWRLSRLEKYIHGTQHYSEKEMSLPTKSEFAQVSDLSSSSAFEEFLNEEPSRRELTKVEQFRNFRKWRQEKGLNWSKP